MIIITENAKKVLQKGFPPDNRPGKTFFRIVPTGLSSQDPRLELVRLKPAEHLKPDVQKADINGTTFVWNEVMQQMMNIFGNIFINYYQSRKGEFLAARFEDSEP